MIELLLPRTDAGVVVQAVVAVVIIGLALWFARRRPDARLLVIGVAVLTAALFGLRAVH